jgi:Trk K+ transport system NAD-binding subunit
MPPGSLIALIHRGGEFIFPRGSTRLLEGDRLTIIGEPLGIQKLREKYGDEN